MLKKLIIAQDTVNDVSIIKTENGLWVCYGVQVTKFDDLTEALDEFSSCQSHAISCNFDM